MQDIATQVEAFGKQVKEEIDEKFNGLHEELTKKLEEDTEAIKHILASAQIDDAQLDQVSEDLEAAIKDYKSRISGFGASAREALFEVAKKSLGLPI